jgi:hypothetical protein
MMPVNVLRLFDFRLSLILSLAGQLNWYDPDSGATVVYNGKTFTSDILDVNLTFIHQVVTSLGRWLRQPLSGS